MHEEVLPRNSLDLMNDLVGSPVWAGWTLAGGTGLALHYGHRLSADFDFFRPDAVPLEDILRRFTALGSCDILQQYEHTLTLLVRGVKLSFFIVADPWIAAPVAYRDFRVAAVVDIALMKLAAMAGRGSRKDFIDLYVILQDAQRMEDLMANLGRKFPGKSANAYHILRSLTWFEDAEKEPMPRMLIPLEWNDCKSFFIREARRVTLPPDVR